MVLTKDSDFVTTFHLNGVPPKLLLISTGNISNNELLRLIGMNLPVLESAFASNRFVEIHLSAIIIHV